MYPDCIAYAKTNNLKFFHKTITSINAEPSVYDIAKGVYLKKSYGYVITAGFGGGGNSNTWANPDKLRDHFDRHGEDFDWDTYNWDVQGFNAYDEWAARFKKEYENMITTNKSRVDHKSTLLLLYT